MIDNVKKRIANEKGAGIGDNSFQIAEAYRAVRTNLLFALADREERTVVVSSAEPSAGKSTLVANLAIVKAQTGAKVLVIDADMRKPQQHRNFRVPRAEGLSKVLAGISTLEDSLCKDVMPGLDLLACGPIPPNPSELLGSKNMKALLEEVKGKYDFIFIDTPPMAVVADALVVAPHTAGVVLVVRQGQTIKSDLKDVVEKIHHSGANLLGVVLSDVKQKTTGYYRKKGYRYYAKYNYKYTSNEKD